MASWAARQKIWILWLTKWEWVRYFFVSYQSSFQHCSVLICHCPWDMRYVRTVNMLRQSASLSLRFVFGPAIVCTQMKEVYLTWTSDESYTVFNVLSNCMIVFKNDAILFWLRWVTAVQYFRLFYLEGPGHLESTKFKCFLVIK